MRAAVFHAPFDIRADEVPDPRVEHGADAVVRITHAGVCCADVWAYRGREPYTPGWRCGHEWAGVVDDVGADVTGLRRGDRVLAPFTLAGASRSLEHGAAWGGGAGDGGQAEAIRAPFADAVLVRIPAAVGDDDAALTRLVTLTDVMASGHHVATCAGVTAGSTVAVIGDGATTLCAVLACRRLGAERIIVLGRDGPGMRLARRLGATDAIDGDDSTAVAQTVELTAGGPARVLQCDGTEQAMRTACAVVRPGGTVAYAGGLAGAVRGIDRARVRADGIVVRGGAPDARRYMRELMDDVLADRLDPSPVLDLQLPLRQVGEAYAAMDERTAIKALVRP